MSHSFKYIGIETTTQCNTKCVVCPRHTNYNHPYTSMSMSLFEEIICDIRDNHEIANHIQFGGMGDASVDKFLISSSRFLLLIFNISIRERFFCNEFLFLVKVFCWVVIEFFSWLSFSSKRFWVWRASGFGLDKWKSG